MTYDEILTRFSLLARDKPQSFVRALTKTDAYQKLSYIDQAALWARIAFTLAQIADEKKCQAFGGSLAYYLSDEQIEIMMADIREALLHHSP